ncbi:MAG: excinuclease ABC subunit UvrA [Pseudomonadales bacterium]|nr:excinuclease ABC subunit UvrA [Pseudomonadales bacterium]
MQQAIIVEGAREHNLKNISLTIPKNKLVIFTGLSGSGKSSLAFDTLYAEGQRRYVESLSSYARQFLGVMQKPNVDHIEGLSPAISIDQKTTSHNPRSTVGTITEIYDYLRLLFARVGRPHCPNCGKEISTQSVDQIVGHIMEAIKERATTAPARILLLSPVVRDRKGEFSSLLETIQKKGYQRVRIDNQLHTLGEDISLIKTNKHTISAVIDRLVVSKQQLKDAEERKRLRSRIAQSVEEALKLSDGLVSLSFVLDESLDFPEYPEHFDDTLYSEQRACSDCGISIAEIEPRLFSFNSPQGACPMCNGLGTLLKIHEPSVVAPALTLSEGAIIPFAKVLSGDTWWARLVRTVVESDTPYDFRKTAFGEMKAEFQTLLLYGNTKTYTVKGTNRQGELTHIQEPFVGFIPELEKRYENTDSEWVRRDIEQYMHKQTCPDCHGTRLTDEALSVHIAGQNIAQITSLPINTTLSWITQLSSSTDLSDKEKTIGESVIKEIGERLSFLDSVGLNYLTLHREAATLAGGEAQRIRLASQIGTGLTGVLYILDEPTIGLHQQDNHRLIETLKNLQEKGNSVIVVEHDRDVMLSADYVFDFGPLAGEGGGAIVAEGTPTQIMKDTKSLTGKYLSRKKDVIRPSSKAKHARRVVSDENIQQAGEIRIAGAHHHNLKHIDVSFPLGKLTVISGISGSGKSTLLHDTLYTNLAKHLGRSIDELPGPIDSIMVPDQVYSVSLIDQNPIGKTPRSNPATYTKMFDYIRKLFASTKDARLRGYTAGRFSFNVKGGRCEACQGDGQLKIEMQFLPDVYVTCDVCEGKRYNEETLEVEYHDKNIYQVLQMSVDEAVAFFKHHTSLAKKAKTLQEVGLGYMQLGQPAPTLSGGEAQRVKLAKELSGRQFQHTVYLLDEPTTGLHFEDTQKLLNVLDKLVAQDNTVIVIEHNLDIIKNADWIIDLGPEGGEGGGEIVAVGTPTQLAEHTDSATGRYLKAEFEVVR